MADTEPGARVYSPALLRIYDVWVLGLSASYAWGAPTRTILEPFFAANMAPRHLDVGVGTGYFPAAALQRPSHDGRGSGSTAAITLVDLNGHALAAARDRIGRPRATRCVAADVLQPLPADLGLHDSIALSYLLHCLPGPPERKARVFGRLARHLAPGGVLFGTTVLGHGVAHNWLGTALMTLYNATGVFGNWGDSERVFREALEREFEQVETRVVGRTLLFRAWAPRVPGGV